MFGKIALINEPKLTKTEHYYIEDHLGRNLSYPFVNFEWHGNSYWLLGKMRWHNVMSVGTCYLRPLRSKVSYPASVIVHPRYSPVTFAIHPPKMRRSPKSSQFYFEGFHPQSVVNIDFVRAESERIASLPPDYSTNRNLPLPRPPAGHIV